MGNIEEDNLRQGDRVKERQDVLQLQRQHHGDDKLDERGGVAAGSGNELQTLQVLPCQDVHNGRACRCEHLEDEAV